jgi:hypothetical protein
MQSKAYHVSRPVLGICHVGSDVWHCFVTRLQVLTVKHWQTPWFVREGALFYKFCLPITLKVNMCEWSGMILSSLVHKSWSCYKMSDTFVPQPLQQIFPLSTFHILPKYHNSAMALDLQDIYITSNFLHYLFLWKHRCVFRCCLY